jgi:hypothetical protein
LAKLRVTHTGSCTQYGVPFSVAAKKCGIEYQYIFGAAQRGSQIRWKQNGKWWTCEKCATDKWGEAPPEGQQASADIEPIAETIQAYRSWVINDGRLKSMNSQVWPISQLEAKCDGNRRTRRRVHFVPDRKCSCGLYAKNTVEGLFGYFSYGLRPKQVFGAVDFWGRVIEADEGYRAQFGKPTALLCIDYTLADDIHATAHRYDIPVVHKVSMLDQVTWGNWEGDDNGDWGREEDGGGARATATGISAGKASCRDAATRARSIEELHFLVEEGIISPGNVMERFV